MNLFIAVLVGLQVKISHMFSYDINNLLEVFVQISKTSFGFCNNLGLRPRSSVFDICTNTSNSLFISIITTRSFNNFSVKRFKTIHLSLDLTKTCVFELYGFVCLGLTSLLNIWGHIAMVPTCSSNSSTNVLPHRNAMPQTQDMTTHPPHYTDTGSTRRCAIHWCGMSHWNTQLPILISCVRPDREIVPRPSTQASERSTLWCCGIQSEAR